MNIGLHPRAGSAKIFISSKEVGKSFIAVENFVWLARAYLDFNVVNHKESI